MNRSTLALALLLSAVEVSAILDGNREADAMIELRKAPFVEIHDLEIRWYGSVGILIDHSTNVTVRGCKVWNDFWHNWPTGHAISARFSPRFTGEQNVLFRQEHGFWLYNSPQARIVQNTCTANLYGAATFLYSVRGSVCKNNDFAFQGNDVLVIEVLKGHQVTKLNWTGLIAITTTWARCCASSLRARSSTASLRGKRCCAAAPKPLSPTANIPGTTPTREPGLASGPGQHPADPLALGSRGRSVAHETPA